MSAMANATPIVTTVTKTANNEKAPDAASKVNILDFCKEHYEDILPIVMEKARRDKRKEGTRTKYRDRSRDEDRFRSVKRWRESESPLSQGSESNTRAVRVWFDELPPESIDGYKGLKAAFLAYFIQQKKYVKDPVEIHNIKKRDGETIEDFMEQFKVETGA
ncbi:hypothetical protein Tco_1000213 [Tanacetum coccineum]